MILRRILFGVLLVLSQIALGMDAFEIQVYDAKINEPGENSLETHLNNVISGLSAPGYPGQVPNQNMTHLTWEYARGMNEYWEMGAYFQTALLPSGNYDFAGAKVRSRFVIPQKNSSPWQWGANFEIAYIPNLFESNLWSGEIRPTIGYEWEKWTFLVNPIFGLTLAPNLNQAPTFEPSAKMIREFAKYLGLGAEYYSDLGPAPTAFASPLAEQYLFAVYDLLNGPFELNVGIGAGLNNTSNPTVAKLIFGFDY